MTIISKSDPKIKAIPHIPLMVSSEDLFLIEQALMGERRTYITLARDYQSDPKAIEGTEKMVQKHTDLISRIQELMKSL